jgi:hypothetical protein
MIPEKLVSEKLILKYLSLGIWAKALKLIKKSKLAMAKKNFMKTFLVWPQIVKNERIVGCRFSVWR